jgi:adenylate cyclase
VERYEGMVNKFIGDCIMAVFGAPNAHEDDVERAVRCALDMQEFLRKYNEVIEEPLGLAVGVNAGPVVAGNIGSERQMEYTVIGDSVNLSQRLEAAAGRGRIFVGPGVKERCSPDIVFKLLDPIRVKGKANPIEVHEVLGIQKSSLDYTEVAEVPYTPRFDEIKLLDRTLATLKNRQYFFATAVGPIGSGKTRLAKEAFQIAQKLGIEIYYLKSDSHHVKSPFYAFTQLCAKLLGEPCLSSKTNWIRLLPYGLDSVDQAIIKSVFELQSFSADHEKSAIHENREAMISVFFKLLQQLNKRSATLLIMENIQFLDESSQDVLKCVLNMEGKIPVGVFLTLRSEKLPLWLESPANQCLMMKPFDGPSLYHFIENLLETKNIPEKLLWLIRSKGMGNPLYIQEIYRNLVSSKKIYNDKGQWIVDKDIEMVNIPSSLGGVFTTRIDTLNMHAKGLLKAAAVLGESFSLENLKVLVGEHFSQIHFDELLKNNLLEENEGLFNFANPFVLETAYRTNLAKDLEALHLSIGVSLEAKASAGKTSLDFQTIDQLATHFKRSNDPYKACEYLSLLAQGLMSTFQLKAAAETLIELLDSLEKKKFIKWSEIELTQQKTGYQIKLAQVLIRSAEFKEAASVIKTAFEAAKLLGNNQFMIRLLRLMAAIYATKGQTDDALKTLQQALSLAKTLQSTELFVNLLADIAEVLQQKNIAIIG